MPYYLHQISHVHIEDTLAFDPSVQKHACDNSHIRATLRNDIQQSLKACGLLILMTFYQLQVNTFVPSAKCLLYRHSCNRDDVASDAKRLTKFPVVWGKS